MKLDFVEACGFRGFRNVLRVDFASGFTVLNGRNGVGKSTILDAIEFAITGEIDKYRVEKAAKESLSDYLWWRGEGSPTGHYVTVGFSHDDGRQFVIRRERANGSSQTPEDIEKALCIAGAKPAAALRQLCRTSIIRDEWISELSLDLSDTDRFELVRTALRAIEGPDYAGKAKEVNALAQAAEDKSQTDYDECRERLSLALTQVAEARDRASRAGDVRAALAIVDKELPNVTGDLASKIIAARSALTQNQMRLVEMNRALGATREFSRARAELQAPSFRALKSTSSKELEAVIKEYNSVQAELAGAREKLDTEEKANDFATGLLALIDNGAKVGLNDHRCPLCDARRTPAQFEAGLTKARARLAELGSTLSATRANVAELERRLRELDGKRQNFNTQFALLISRERSLEDRREQLTETLRGQGLDTALISSPAALEEQLAAERSRLIDLERSILTLEASQAVDEVTAAEARVEFLRHEVDSFADRLSRAHESVTVSKSIDRAVRRTNAEILDERLASISPLLNELYQRLRPHNKWNTIAYNIRGDLRRFLSLTVGENLNPQFIFSSGQRRAAGLAFLLSVHLSRPWCRWKTLLLDDPVQHIDDYRALHLVEVLAALRRDGRQIVCAVEDAALADLVCRRLRRSLVDEGSRIDLDMDTGGEPSVSKISTIPPMPAGVLQRSLAAG